MWIYREFEHFLAQMRTDQHQPIKILKGPRQVGKTSLLVKLGQHKLISFDDLSWRQRAQDDPRLFLDQFDEPLILDEATLAPHIFPELKRRVDELKRRKRAGQKYQNIDIWLTGSNQTLLEKNVQESLAGRASFFDLNTLAWSELPDSNLQTRMLRGGWPELFAEPGLSAKDFLNDLISTFIEKDIVLAAGIERKAAFTRSIGLLAARVGQLLNASDIARNVGVDTTTIQSWLHRLEQNALVRIIPAFSTNLNQRIIKTPKVYFEDVGLASRFQGWTNYEQLFISSQFGHLVENLALIEILRFFQNRAQKAEVFFVRSKEKVEIDFLIHLGNGRYIAAEVKTGIEDFTQKQMDLLNTMGVEIKERWVLSLSEESFKNKYSHFIHIKNVSKELLRVVSSLVSEAP